MNVTFFLISLGCYLGAVFFHLLYLINRRGWASHWGNIFVFLGFIFHTIAFGTRFFQAGHIPITNLHESLSFFAWTIILIYLVLDYKIKIPSLGAFILPLAFIFVLYASVVPKGIQPLIPALQSFWLGIHTITSFAGYATFAFAFCAGIMYLIQESQLKSKKFGPLYYRLPSLEILDDLSHKIISFGFPLLTIGIITGSLWASSAWGSYWSWDPKETWALITWFIYAAVVHSRFTVGWRGRKAAYLAIIGFCFVLFTFLGVNLLLKGLHSYA